MNSDYSIEQIPVQLTWDIRQEVLYPGRPRSLVFIEDDAEGIHFGLFHNNTLIGVISLFDRGEELVFRKFAIKKEYQNKKLGSSLLEYVIAYAKTMNKKYIACSARESALKFYQKFGFTSKGEPFLRNGINFLTMSKEL